MLADKFSGRRPQIWKSSQAYLKDNAENYIDKCFLRIHYVEVTNTTPDPHILDI